MAEDWTERGAVARMNLNTVLGWADILADPAIEVTAEKRREYAEHIATAGGGTSIQHRRFSGLPDESRLRRRRGPWCDM